MPVTTDNDRPDMWCRNRRHTPKRVLRDANGGGPWKKNQYQPPPSHYERAWLQWHPVDEKTRDCPYHRSEHEPYRGRD